jgi:hypothetical protein
MWLNDAAVYDPFMGGGTSLVESARMGASVFGRDVDPIAVEVVKLELLGLSHDFGASSTALIKNLEQDFGRLFGGPEADWIPLHWFWLLKPNCPECKSSGLLYKDLIIAMSIGRGGSVVRDSEIHAFCPTCLAVHELGRDRKVLNCCGRRYRLGRGTFALGKYTCPQCGKKSSHEDLQTANSQRVMVAVEETRVGSHRRIRAATAFDTEISESVTSIPLPSQDFDIALGTDRRDRRPLSAGYTSLRKMFTARQWVVLTTAFSRIRKVSMSGDLERELTLMLTGALPANNVLCGYARDYGRLAALFSIRGFSFPSLIVELNLFHPTGGRGTLRSAQTRMMERSDPHVRRAYMTDDQVEKESLELPVEPSASNIVCRSADDHQGQENISANICVTDPPYFDYIAYSELSEFFRLWLRKPHLEGTPLLPESASPVDSFAAGLGGALKATLTRLQPGTPLVFTYHSPQANAWRAIGDAFDIADLSVVALWPILADPHMGHHTADGNCEWDVVVVARRNAEVEKISEGDLTDLPRVWLAEIECSEFSVGRGDRASFEHAWVMGRGRFARSRKAAERELP